VLPVTAAHCRAAAKFVDQLTQGLRARAALRVPTASEHGATVHTLDQRLAEAGPVLGVPTQLRTCAGVSLRSPTAPMADDWTITRTTQSSRTTLRCWPRTSRAVPTTRLSTRALSERTVFGPRSRRAALGARYSRDYMFGARYSG
jgi:hypothetical protein